MMCYYRSTNNWLIQNVYKELNNCTTILYVMTESTNKITSLKQMGNQVHVYHEFIICITLEIVLTESANNITSLKHMGNVSNMSTSKMRMILTPFSFFMYLPLLFCVSFFLSSCYAVLSLTSPFDFIMRAAWYRARLKGLTFEFFRRCGTFFVEKNCPRRVLLPIFWSFSTVWVLENPKGYPSQFFSDYEAFFEKKFSSKCRQFTNPSALWSLFSSFEPLIWRRLGPVSACWIR